MPKKYTPEEREALFWSHADKSGGPDACWLWRGCVSDKGYGMAVFGGRPRRAHRVAFALAAGVDISETCVLHRSNLRLTCAPCNNQRGDLSVFQLTPRQRRLMGAA